MTIVILDPVDTREKSVSMKVLLCVTSSRDLTVRKPTEEVLFAGVTVVLNRDELVGILPETSTKLLYVAVVGELLVTTGVKERIADASPVKLINADTFLVDKLLGVTVTKIGVDLVVVSVSETDVGTVALLLIPNLELRRGDDLPPKTLKLEAKILLVG